MSNSLTWLRDPAIGPALPDLLCGLIGDIRLILIHPDLGNAAKLAAITGTVDRLAPPPGPETGDARAAASVAALLAGRTGPATVLFEELVGERVHIELSIRADRPLTAAECLELRTSPGARGHQRTGVLRTVYSGLVVAEVSSIIVPARLPTAALRALGIPGPEHPTPTPSSIPLGKVLADLGVRREPLGVRLAGGSTGTPGSRVSVEASARMWLASALVALASERVTAEFCRRARNRLAHVTHTGVLGSEGLTD
jgi:hypothetical protein